MERINRLMREGVALPVAVCVLGSVCAYFGTRALLPRGWSLFGGGEGTGPGLVDVVTGALDRLSPPPSANEAALESDLQTLRCQVELYRIQHNDRLPGCDANGGLVPGLFERHMTTKTDAAGKAMGAGADPSDYPFGPYLQMMPTNPFASARGDKVAGGPGPAPGDGTTGWYLDVTSGTIHPNDSEHRDL